MALPAAAAAPAFERAGSMSTRQETGGNGPGQCPRREELERYVRAELPPDSSAAIEAHLDACPPCQNTLASLERKATDSLVNSLRSAIGDESRMQGKAAAELAKASAIEPTDRPASTRREREPGPVVTAPTASASAPSAPRVPVGVHTLGRIRDYWLLEKLDRWGGWWPSSSCRSIASASRKPSPASNGR
jgi:hypothetical protein